MGRQVCYRLMCWTYCEAVGRWREDAVPIYVIVLSACENSNDTISNLIYGAPHNNLQPRTAIEKCLAC